MIYVFKSAAVNSSDEYFELIKIGYAEDARAEYKSYLGNNPTLKLLYVFESGTYADERRLHEFLRYYNEDYPTGWFKLVPKIEKFFKTNDTIEKIREVVKNTSVLDSHTLKRAELVIIAKALAQKIGEPRKTHEIFEEFKKRGITNTHDVCSYIKENYEESVAMELIKRIIFWPGRD